MSNLRNLYEEASKYYIGGVCAEGRYNKVLGQALYINRASGSRVYDVDGHEYIDYHTGAGAAMYGHNHPRLRKAVEKALDIGFFMNFDTEYHVELAKLLREHFPGAEKIRLTNTGSEATMGAIRIARCYSGKNLVMKCDGHFHGMHENIWYNHSCLAEMDRNGEVETVPDSAGFPDNSRDVVKNVAFNNIDALEQAVKKYRGQVAAIILEPVSFNCGCIPAKKEYLQQVRALCDREEIVLIFDEVISGLRFRPGSAQKYYDVIPDLTAVGKAVGGGFSIAAVAGKDRFMRKLNPEGKAGMSGTYTGALMPVLAAVECLKMCGEPDFYDHIDATANALYGGLNELLEKHRIPGHVRGMGARFAIYFGVEDPEDDYDFRKLALHYNRDIYKKFVTECLPQGLFFQDSAGAVSTPHWGFTTQHTLNDIDMTLEKIDAIFFKISQKQ